MPMPCSKNADLLKRQNKQAIVKTCCLMKDLFDTITKRNTKVGTCRSRFNLLQRARIKVLVTTNSWLGALAWVGSATRRRPSKWRHTELRKSWHGIRFPISHNLILMASTYSVALFCYLSTENYQLKLVDTLKLITNFASLYLTVQIAAQRYIEHWLWRTQFERSIEY